MRFSRVVKKHIQESGHKKRAGRDKESEKNFDSARILRSPRPYTYYTNSVRGGSAAKGGPVDNTAGKDTTESEIADYDVCKGKQKNSGAV